MADVKVEEGSLRDYYLRYKNLHIDVYKNIPFNVDGVMALLESFNKKDDEGKKLYFIIYNIICPHCLDVLSLDNNFIFQCPECSQKYNDAKFEINKNSSVDAKMAWGNYRESVLKALYDSCTCGNKIRYLSCPDCKGKIDLDESCGYIYNTDCEVVNV